MTEYFKSKAREWLDKQSAAWHSAHNTHDAVEFFARHLDQEAQEKPQQPECEHGVDTDITARKSYQPQQPEKISELDCEANGGDVYAKIQEIIRTLNRLTHKD